MGRKKREFGEPARSIEKNWLGEFINFSATIHGLGRVYFGCSVPVAQQTVVETMQSLNGLEEPRLLSVSSPSREVEGKMGFEVGIANGVFFDNLDEATATDLIQFIHQDGGCKVLDFYLAATYHYSRRGKMSPLRFDHHHFRFFFEEGAIQVLLHHVRGTMRLPFDELFQIIFDRLRRRAEQQRLGEVTTEVIRTL